MRTLCAGMLVVASTAAWSAEKEPCQAVAGFAEAVMAAHQQGVPLTQLMEIEQNPDRRAYIIDVYQSPRFSTAEIKAKAIAEARDSMAATCYSR